MKKFISGLGLGTLLGFAAAILAGFAVCEITETIAVPEEDGDEDD